MIDGREAVPRFRGSQVLRAYGLWGMWLSGSSLSVNSLGQFLMGTGSASVSTEFSVGNYLLRGKLHSMTHLGTLYENRLLVVRLLSGVGRQG